MDVWISLFGTTLDRAWMLHSPEEGTRDELSLEQTALSTSMDPGWPSGHCSNRPRQTTSDAVHDSR